jgi:hypothetical protein
MLRRVVLIRRSLICPGSSRGRLRVSLLNSSFNLQKRRISSTGGGSQSHEQGIGTDFTSQADRSGAAHGGHDELKQHLYLQSSRGPYSITRCSGAIPALATGCTSAQPAATAQRVGVGSAPLYRQRTGRCSASAAPMTLERQLKRKLSFRIPSSHAVS